MHRLVPADETLNHQIAEPFATVSESDLAWTEKLWVTAFSTDGALQIDTGFGKYPNRNVFDGFGGISRGREQWTVRGSRRLDARPEAIAVGPLSYEVLEPLRAVRVSLAHNDVQPIAFEITCTGLLPPFLEDPHRQREPHGTRISADLQRYHQALVAEGWVEIEGKRTEIRPHAWLGVRDHSWGVRTRVGPPVAGLYQPAQTGAFVQQWGELMFARPDGSRYELQYAFRRQGETSLRSTMYFNEPDGGQTAAHGMREALRYDPATRRLLGGSISLDMGWGGTRTVELEAIGDTGFHLGSAGYFGHKGRYLGMWVGEDALDGEYYEDVTRPEVLREVHQIRDCVVRVREGEASGFGIVETVLTGEHPELGLDAASSFV
jgi:hypothetical protein